MTESIGDLSGRTSGTPVTFDLLVVDAASGDPLPGAAVYLWHCTADGQYTIYELEDQNYLRAVQAADDASRVTFTSIYPGCYFGRWPHAHFEVFSTLDSASNGASAIKTPQLALPDTESAAIYVDSAYGNSESNLRELSLDTDGVLEDGWGDQMATVSGAPATGVTASLLVRIKRRQHTSWIHRRPEICSLSPLLRTVGSMSAARTMSMFWPLQSTAALNLMLSTRSWFLIGDGTGCHLPSRPH